MFSPKGHGMSCFHCDNCNCRFAIDCLDVDYIDKIKCPNCGESYVIWTRERLTGSYSREWESVEDYEEEMG